MSKAFRLDGSTVLDLLAHGRQTVVPPSIHPETGAPYIWLTVDTLEHVAPEHLPLLPDDIAERIAEALKPFGVEPDVERPRVERAANDDDEWRETNDTALANLDAWVPGLGIGAKFNGASWRGNARKGGDSFALSFHPTGIKDFVTDESYSPIDIVPKIADVEPYEAMRLLRERLGLYVEPEPPPVYFTFEEGANVREIRPGVLAEGGQQQQRAEPILSASGYSRRSRENG